MIVLFALALTGLAGLAGLVVDVGYLYVQHAHMQDGVDAACLAGAAKLPSVADAMAAAEEYAAANKLTKGTLESTFPANNRIDVKYTEVLDTFFLRILGIDNATIKVYAAAILPPSTQGDPAVLALKLNGGSILRMNGNNINIDGSVHSNSNLGLNGWIRVDGDATAVGTVTLGTNVTVTGDVRSGVDPLPAPDYEAQINALPTQTYGSSQRFNGNNVNIDGTISVNGNVDINGNNISGDGSILATGDIHNNGNAISTTGTGPMFFYTSDGNIHINGNNITIDAILFAPNGEIVINGNNITINGRVIGQTVTVNGSGLTVNSPDGGGTGSSSVPQLIE
ncbi:MAG TPA: pilus assembly protein TadG-related protein [Negativicutes bacterium]|nr:pilus assembly protein TadG-related protein [Negativicutes bacterium]